MLYICVQAEPMGKYSATIAHSVCILHQFVYTTSGIKFMFEFLGIKAWVQGHLYPACMASSSRCANAVSNQLHFLPMNLLATELTCYIIVQLNIKSKSE